MPESSNDLREYLEVLEPFVRDQYAQVSDLAPPLTRGFRLLPFDGISARYLSSGES